LSLHCVKQEDEILLTFKIVLIKRILIFVSPISSFSSYCSMDCLALLKQCSDITSPTLVNATQHFIATQLFGPHYFQSLVQTPEAIGRLQTYLPVLLSNLNAFKQKSEEIDGHLSKSAAEFLLDPWLLIQLPWNAALLNQWLMAALAEVFKFKKAATCDKPPPRAGRMHLQRWRTEHTNWLFVAIGRRKLEV
jgi:hypothetical protein